MDFLRNNTRFSFLYDGKDIFEYEYKKEVAEDGNTLTVTYTFKDGLKITNTAKKIEKYGAYEWVNYFENTSDKPTGLISELYDCYVKLPIEYEKLKIKESYLPDTANATKIYAPEGSGYNLTEFSVDVDVLESNNRINHLYTGQQKRYSTSGGRSSEKHAPFFNLHKNGKGYIFAIGWTGQWMSEFERIEEEITFKSGIESANFRMLPGEAFRTSSIVLMPYEGEVVDSQNKWRRLVKENYSQIGPNGRAENGPLCGMLWGGMKTEYALDRINKIVENDIPFEYIWMDAGWYGTAVPTPDEFEGDWQMHTGNWQPSLAIHPNGLKDVSEAIHNSNRKFLLWLEPERAFETAPMKLEHPEYFLSVDDNKSSLLNLGLPEAWDYCYNMLADLFERLSIDCYRQDFNLSPLNYWLKNDEPDRRGITEIKHINGLYKLWDALLERFPNLIIDNCASGGRRIDIETSRRSIPLWRSDYQCNANYDIKGSQCHHMSFNTWIPYTGTGAGRAYDEYRIRSAYDAAMGLCHSFSAREEFCEKAEEIAFLKKYTEEYLSLRPYFSADYYPLTEMSTCDDAWCAVQFDRPEEKDGIVQVFKREKSPYPTANFTLRGIKADKNYLFTDIDGGEEIFSGEKLINEGFNVTINQKPKAKIFLYKEI